jgi:outer membrane protein OmpA-like peptidoglycan-associated protein
LAFFVLPSACAPATRVNRLPQASVAPSAVVGSTGQGLQMLPRPYAVAELSRSGGSGLGTTTAKLVHERHPQLLALQTPAPQRFVLPFEPGSLLLTLQAQAQWPDVIARALSLASGEIVISGHTGRQASLEANDSLSLERAQAIGALLIACGFAPERIDAMGCGEREPVMAPEDEVVKPHNRRADVRVRRPQMTRHRT